MLLNNNNESVNIEIGPLFSIIDQWIGHVLGSIFFLFFFLNK